MDTGLMKYYYEQGLWTLERLEKLLTAGKITQTEFAEITGNAYNV